MFQAVQAAAVVVGVGFAVFETRRYHRDRNREAAMELLHAFQTPEFARALVLVYRLPDGLSKEQIESSSGQDPHLVYAMTTTWESIGVLVFRGEVSIDVVDDFFTGLAAALRSGPRDHKNQPLRRPRQRDLFPIVGSM